MLLQTLLLQSLRHKKCLLKLGTLKKQWSSRKMLLVQARHESRLQCLPAKPIGEPHWGFVCNPGGHSHLCGWTVLLWMLSLPFGTFQCTFCDTFYGTFYCSFCSVLTAKIVTVALVHQCVPSIFSSRGGCCEIQCTMTSIFMIGNCREGQCTSG